MTTTLRVPLVRALATLQAAGLGALAALAASVTLAHHPDPHPEVCWQIAQPGPVADLGGVSVQPDVREGRTVGLRVVVDPSAGRPRTVRAALAGVDAQACG
jgi:hypothetical protein